MEAKIVFGIVICHTESQVHQLGIRMTIIKLDNNKLFIHSPIEINAALQQQISQLGEVAYVVTPNKSHNIYLSDWWLASPQAYFYALQGSFINEEI